MTGTSGGPVFSAVAQHDACRLDLAGELDAHSAPLLIKHAAQLSDAHDVLIDLAGVDFMDAAGLSGLITVNNLCSESGRRLIIVGTTSRIARVFTLGRASWLLQPPAPAARVIDELVCAVVGALHAASDSLRISVFEPEMTT